VASWLSGIALAWTCLSVLAVALWAIVSWDYDDEGW
jgi:hypothetical protein